MVPRDTTSNVHEHPCGHNCTCCWGNSQLCDRCEIADVVLMEVGDASR